MKILLIASLFPPVRHTGALRWTRLCRRMVPMGCEFHVVTTAPGFWSPPHEDAELVPGVKVDRVDYPSNFVMSYLKLTMWGIHKFKRQVPKQVEPVKQEVIVKRNLLSMMKGQVGLLLRGLSQLPQPIFERLMFPHYSKYWAKSVVEHCSKCLNANDYDVIIATHPYAGSLIAAQQLSKLWGVPWVADFRDPWTHDMQSPLRDNPPMLKRMWQFEGETLNTASAVVSINRQMCEFLNAPDEKMHVITNSYEPSDYPLQKADKKSSKEVLNLCYTGSIADDHEYRLFLDGMKCFHDRCDAKVILHYYGGAFLKLIDYAQEIGLDERCLRNHGYVKHEEANQRLAEADCGVVFGWRGPLAKLVSTGKIFDSLGVQSPILGICSISGSGMEDIILQSGSGSVLHSAKEIADVLSQAATAKKKGQLNSLLAPSFSEEKRALYTTEKVAEDYLLLLRKLIN